MSARFGDMLLTRRRQLGMSIQQVANTVKIRPQIIEFFETGNFASMPPRGYAQGMIASYARFLGLNPRDVVNTYFDELVEYEHASGNQAGRFQEGAGYVSQRSNTQNGRFLMVNGGRPDGSRYGQRPPQAGYVTESGSGREIREMRDRVRRTLPPADRAVPTSYQLGTRDPRAGYGDGSYPRKQQLQRQRTVSIARSSNQNVRRAAPHSSAPYSAQKNAVSGARQLRPVSRQGRGPSSHNSSRSRDARNINQQGRRRNPQQRRRSTLSSFDPRFIIGGIVVALVVIALVITMVVKGCSATMQQGDQSAKTVVTQKKATAKKTANKISSSSKKSSTDESVDSTDSLDSLDATTQSDSADGSLVVRVKVAKKKTAWVEVKVDGKSVYAAQTTGPFDKKFIPGSSVEITTSKPSFVSVLKNGKKVRYDTKTSGVARVTITVPTKTTTASDENTTNDTDTTDSTDTSDSTDASDSSSSSSSSGTTSSRSQNASSQQ